MKKIPLTKGYVALVDDEDYELATSVRWTACESIVNIDGRQHVRGVYAVSKHKDEHGKIVSLHRMIMCPPPHLVVDHIDGDGLNNTRSNLRVATYSENIANRRAGYVGPEFYPVYNLERIHGLPAKHNNPEYRLPSGQLAMNIQQDLHIYFKRTGTGPKELAAKIGLKRWQYIKRVVDGERKGFGPELLAKVGAVIYQRKAVGTKKQPAPTANCQRA